MMRTRDRLTEAFRDAGLRADDLVLVHIGLPWGRIVAHLDVSSPLQLRSPPTQEHSMPFVSAQAAENRRAITELMARHGFVTYPWEFWRRNWSLIWQTGN